MIAAIDTAARKVNIPIYQLKVVLVGSKPPLHRRLRVPGDARLDWLHAVLQVAIGWTNSHLHQFRVGGNCYSDPRHHLAENDGDPEILDERKFTLQKIAPGLNDSFDYDYDFGDSWRHRITVDKFLPPDATSATIAVCIGGARACPPEDCGGIFGYDNLLKILKNAGHPEHQSMKEWLGRPFDAGAFDAERTNFWLRKLKWPRVTEGQLGKILMGRDDDLE